MRTRGFSLVELSIVLVILGLLVGGVLGGRALVNAAQLRTVSADVQRYKAAVYTFRDKYFYLPGDMPNATSFWGDQATGTDACADAAVVDGTPGTCNGDGNGLINGIESFRLWQQLARAGIIEGSYTGYKGTMGINHTIPGQNAPITKYSGSGIAAYEFSVPGGPMSSRDFVYDYGNQFFYGGVNVSDYPEEPLFSPEEAWNIDTKMDDGKPGTGSVIASRHDLCTNSSSGTDYTTTYKLTSSGALCRFRFKQAF
ncbi:MAG: prepilin-type N-terminal cleavage/methylation domain-containing protein [Pseudomonadota bacterium]